MPFPSLEPMQIAWSVGVLLFAYFIRGIAGFGSALIAVPLLAFFLPVPKILPIIALLDWIASTSQGLPHRRLISWPDLLPLLPFSAVGIVSGLLLHAMLDGRILSIALALFILGYAIYALLPLPALRGGRGYAAPAGFFGGLIGALFGTGGPPYVVYLTLRQLDKNQFRATVATIFVIDGFCRITAFALAGYYTWPVLATCAVLLPVELLALRLGGRMHLSISHQGFVRLVSCILLGSGISLLVKAF
ncbi:MAG: sulfite exporter TauE/SafE family protein [Thermodesulfobacteriota bacterium]